MDDSLKGSIFKLLSPILADRAVELVAVEDECHGVERTLRLLISKPDGVTPRDCEDVGEFVGPILQIHGLITKRYNLEVASPGLDRPLRSESDFRRHLSRNLQIGVTSSSGEILQISGVLQDVSRGNLSLIQRSGEMVRVELSQVAKAEIKLLW